MCIISVTHSFQPHPNRSVDFLFPHTLRPENSNSSPIDKESTLASTALYQSLNLHKSDCTHTYLSIFKSLTEHDDAGAVLLPNHPPHVSNCLRQRSLSRYVGSPLLVALLVRIASISCQAEVALYCEQRKNLQKALTSRTFCKNVGRRTSKPTTLNT